MAFTGPYIADSFKKLLLDLIAAKSIKLALYDNSPSFTAATAAYTTSGELVATGYTAGGKALTGVATAVSGNIAYLDFADVSWTSFSGSPYGAQMYDASDSNKTMLVIDFGGPQHVIGGTLGVVWPAADNTHSIFRIA